MKVKAEFVRESDEWGAIFKATCPDCGHEIHLTECKIKGGRDPLWEEPCECKPYPSRKWFLNIYAEDSAKKEK